MNFARNPMVLGVLAPETDIVVRNDLLSKWGLLKTHPFNRRPWMALTIPHILRQFKADVAKALSAEIIRQVCDRLGHVWRERVLDPVTTIHVFLLQILHGNTACTALARLARMRFTATAYCEARKRLPMEVFAVLLQRTCAALLPETQETGRWHGHRTWTMDGSSFSMSDTPDLQARFGQPAAQAKGCGFPTAHLLALFHAGTGLLMDVLASPLRTHDMKHAATMHPDICLDSGPCRCVARACIITVYEFAMRHDKTCQFMPRDSRLSPRGV